MLAPCCKYFIFRKILLTGDARDGRDIRLSNSIYNKLLSLNFSKTYRARKCLTADSNGEDDDEEEEEEEKEDVNGPVSAT